MLLIIYLIVCQIFVADDNFSYFHAEKKSWHLDFLNWKFLSTRYY